MRDVLGRKDTCLPAENRAKAWIYVENLVLSSKRLPELTETRGIRQFGDNVEG
jgi:hypothetical protein